MCASDGHGLVWLVYIVYEYTEDLGIIQFVWMGCYNVYELSDDGKLA